MNIELNLLTILMWNQCTRVLTHNCFCYSHCLGVQLPSIWGCLKIGDEHGLCNPIKMATRLLNMGVLNHQKNSINHEYSPELVDSIPILQGQKKGLAWWLIPLSKWVITPVISGLTLLVPFITWGYNPLTSRGMSHQVSHLFLLPGSSPQSSYLNLGPSRGAHGQHHVAAAGVENSPRPCARCARRRCRRREGRGGRSISGVHGEDQIGAPYFCI